MPEHPYGYWSLLPPTLAIVLAIGTRRVIISLLAGVLSSALILAHGNPLAAIVRALEGHLWPSLSDPGHLRVFVFTLLMGAMVGVIHRCGGMHGVVDRLGPLASTRRRGQLVTWALGLIIFFDDYANTLLLGGTMRPLADRLKISREKLAFLVDSTAAPVAGLAVISTWVAGEIGYINEGLTQLDLQQSASGFQLFIATIPFRFYVILVLCFVPLVAVMGRDFGAMLQAERAAQQGRIGVGAAGVEPSEHQVPRRWFNAVIPIAVMVAATCWLLIATGRARLLAEGQFDASVLTMFTKGDSYVALLYGSLIGLAAAWLLAWGQGILDGYQLRRAALAGAWDVMPALVVLWMAWSLSHTTARQFLDTAGFLGSLLERGIPAALMPTLVFVLASLVSFATGTSWGTMGILMPLVIASTYRMLPPGSGPMDTVMVATVGSVLAGAIFGDHCSPISDTTVLSSHASGCNHVAHVWTQLPYALLVAAVSVFCGTLPAALGVPVWILLPLGVLVLTVALRLLGRTVDPPDQAAS